MGFIYNQDKKRTFGKSVTEKPEKKEESELEKIQHRVENYETRFDAADVELPKPKKESNLLLKTLDILDRPRNAILSGLTGQGFTAGLTGESRVNVADLLEDKVENKYLRGGLGFVGDVLMDPLTYLTFGTAGIAKGAATGAAKGLAKGAAKEALEEGGKRTFLKFAGAPIADVTPLVRGTREAIEKTKAYETIAPMFSNKALRRSTLAAEEIEPAKQIRDLLLGTERGIHGEQKAFLGEFAKQTRNLNLPEEAWSKASALIEAPTQWRQRGATLKPRVAKGATKEPWQITKDEFITARPIVEGYHYHGSPEGKLTMVDPYTHTQNWREGLGFYTTESRDLAEKYARGRTARGERKGKQGAVNYIKHTASNILDMDAPADMSLWKQLAKKVDAEGFEKNLLPKATNREAYHEIIDYLDIGIEGQYVVEEGLIDLGIDATAHMEGLKSGKPHKVLVHKGDKVSVIPAEMVHKEVVEKALAEGKAVSYEVLKDYPELISKFNIKPKDLSLPNMIRSSYRLGDKPSQEAIKAAKAIRQVTKETTEKDVRAGVKFAEIPNYIRHLYKDPPEKVQAVLSQWAKKKANIPGKKAGFQKERFIPTIAEAKKMGLKPIEDTRVLTAVREMEGIRQRAIMNMYGEMDRIAGGTLVRDAKMAAPGWKTFPGIEQLKGKAVHPEVARFLERFNSTINTDEGMRTALSMLNNVQNFWKGLVTAPNPMFHVRNELGNIWNNFLAGVVDPNVYRLAAVIQRGGDEAITLGGKEYTGSQLLSMFRQEGLEGFGFFMGESPRRLVEEATDAFKQKITFSPIKGGRKIGDALETNAKLAHFIDKLNKGHSPKEAAESVRKYLFDYGDLTETEKRIRNFIPFFTFTRKNIPLQLEHLVTNPGKMTAVNKLVENMKSVMGTEEGDMPDWMKSELAIPIGNDQYLTMDLPINQLNMLGSETGRNVLGMLSPLAKVPVELAMNQQIFSGAPIEKYPGAVSRYGNLQLPAKLSYGLSQFGAIPRTAADILGSMRDSQLGSGKIPPQPKQLPVVSSLIRRVDPEREQMLRGLEREDQLSNYRRLMEEVKGIDIPTLAEIEAATKQKPKTTTKKKKGRGFVY